MDVVALFRLIVHRPYVRAAAVGFSIALLGCSLGLLCLRLTHGVSVVAVARYFARPHLDLADLAPLLRHRATGTDLETLLLSTGSDGIGGLIYTEGGHLSFHPHADADLQRRWRRELENRAVYWRLAPLYHRDDATGLADALSLPGPSGVLRSQGLEPARLATLAANHQLAVSDEDRARALRAIGSFLRVFEPRSLTPSWLGLGDSLRFYEAEAPAGRFVGQFALLDSGGGARFDEAEALELGRRHHYVLIAPVGDHILLLDFYRGRARRYDIRPFDHSIGSRLYHLVVAG